MNLLTPGPIMPGLNAKIEILFSSKIRKDYRSYFIIESVLGEQKYYINC